MCIIFDLDGTVIDASERMYRLFCELIPQSKLSKEEYWNLKRDNISHKLLLEKFFPEVNYKQFSKKWISSIEKAELLLLDKNYVDTIQVLSILSTNTNLYLITARQSRENLLQELDRLKIRKYFKRIFVTQKKLTKRELLQQSCIELPILKNEQTLFVSDMGRDIQLGKSYGYRTVAISHGFMSQERLEEYNPNYLIDELSQIIELI